MVLNLKYIFVFLCIVFLSCSIFFSCSKEINMDNEMNETSTQLARNKPNVNPTDPNTSQPLRLDKIKFSTKLTKKQFISDWGTPYAVAGSGFDYLIYKLDDGRFLQLWFASQEPYPLVRAFVYTYDSATDSFIDRKIIFDGINDTTLR